MGVVLRMPDKKEVRSPGTKGTARSSGVVVHAGANLRDVERLMKYIKHRDDRRGRD